MIRNEMNDNTISFFIHRILSKKIKFYFCEEQYELLYPSNDLKYDADIIYYHIVNEEKYGNWLREEYMTEIMTELELWNNNIEPQIQSFNKQIEELKLSLFKSYTMLTQKQMQQKKRNIRNLEKQINIIHNKKQEFHANTLEGYAESIRQEHIISNTLYKNNELVFNSKDKREQSYNKFNQIISEINKHQISNNTYRDIAKSDIWRSYWSNHANGSVFDGAICNWSDEQRNLANTSQMYDSVYAHPECPNDTVIDDHDLLDGWMIQQKRNNAKNKKEAELNRSNKKLGKAGEVFLMSGNELDTAKEIQSMNDAQSMSVFKTNMEQMEKEGSVDVVDMRTTTTVLVPEQRKNQSPLKVRKNF